MSTQKRKFELFTRLQALGFTYDEAAQLRRIEMTLQRWAERECGDGSSWAIERDDEHALTCTQCGHVEWSSEPLSGNCPKCGDCAPIRHIATGKPFNVYHGEGKPRRYPIADREAGALRRLAAIVKARNLRESPSEFMQVNAQDWILPYHQGDCRGCMVYLVTRSQLGDSPIAQVYNRGVAVCA